MTATEDVDYAHAALLIESVLGECMDRDDLVTQCITAVGRVLPDLSDTDQDRVLAAVQVISRHWLDSASLRPGANADPDELPHTVRRALVTEHAVWVNGDSDTCPHRPRPSDGVACGYAWRPNLVTCTDNGCRDGWLRRAPSYCMGCGADVDPRQLWTFQLGPLLWHTTLCADCLPTTITERK